MKINTRVFGEVDIEESKILTFPGGIVGFPDMEKFTLIHDEEKGMRVDFFDVVTEFRDLCQIDDGKDDALIHAGEGALPVEEGRTVVNVAEDGVCDLKRLVRNDEGGFPLGEADDETA